MCDVSSSYCDDFDILSPLEKGQAYVVTSDDGERRFFTEQQNFNQEVGNSSRLRLTLNPGKHLPFFGLNYAIERSVQIWAELIIRHTRSKFLGPTRPIIQA